MARIQSGHPARGALSIETDVDLEQQPTSSPSANVNGARYAQFFRADPAVSGAQEQLPSALDIPGPNPSDWANPRFLFVTPSLNTTQPGGLFAVPPSPPGAAAGASTGTVGSGKKKAQVFALPNMFLASSEKGWISNKASSGTTASKTRGVGGHVTQVPGSSVMLSLTVEEDQ